MYLESNRERSLSNGVDTLTISLGEEKHAKTAIALILLLSLFLNTYGIGWGLPDFEGWVADELIPARVLTGIEQGFSNGWYYKYPPVHFYLLAALYSPFWVLHQFSSLDVYSLPIYTVLFYLGRLLSVCLGAAIVYIVYLCGREVYDKASALFAALITALLCPFVYYAKTINLDVPYLFWFALSLLFYIRILKGQRLADYLWFSATATITFCTKDQAYGFYVLTPVFLIIYYHFYRKSQNAEVRLIDSILSRRVVLSLLLGLALFLILQNIPFNLKGFLKHVSLTTGGGASIRPRFEKNLLGHVEMFWQSLVHLRFSFGWPAFLVVLLGVLSAFLKKKKNALLNWTLLPIASYYLFYISLIMFNDVRYLLPCCIVLSLFAGQALANVWTLTRNFPTIGAVLISSVLAYTFAYSFSVDTLMAQDSRYFVEQWMQQNIEGQALVWGIGYPKYLPRLRQFRSESTDEPSVNALQQIDPDYIVETSGYDVRRFAEGTPEQIFFSRLDKGELGYQLVLRYQSQPVWDLLNHEELGYRHLERMRIYSNFDKINPEIKIFRKS